MGRTDFMIRCVTDQRGKKMTSIQKGSTEMVPSQNINFRRFSDTGGSFGLAV